MKRIRNEEEDELGVEREEEEEEKMRASMEKLVKRKILTLRVGQYLFVIAGAMGK